MCSEAGKVLGEKKKEKNLPLYCQIKEVQQQRKTSLTVSPKTNCSFFILWPLLTLLTAVFVLQSERNGRRQGIWGTQIF